MGFQTLLGSADQSAASRNREITLKASGMKLHFLEEETFRGGREI